MLALPILLASTLMAAPATPPRSMVPAPEKQPDVSEGTRRWAKSLGIPATAIVSSGLLQGSSLGPFSGVAIARFHDGRHTRTALATVRPCDTGQCLGSPVRLRLERIRPVALLDLGANPQDVPLTAEAELDRAVPAPKAMKDPALLVRASERSGDDHHWTLLGLQNGELKVLWGGPAVAVDAGGSYRRTELGFESSTSGRPDLVFAKRYVEAKGSAAKPQTASAVERFEWSGTAYTLKKVEPTAK